jgi:hypothetical protein
MVKLDVSKEHTMNAHDKTRMFHLLCEVTRRTLTPHESLELKRLQKRAGRTEVKARRKGAKRAAQWGYA